MRWFLAVVSFVGALLLAGTMPAITQGTEFRIVSASPTGEVGQLSDADEVRVVFSEPMVALGAVPPVSAPSWVRMTPAVPGSFYWSGTRTLIFSPDASKPLPNATKFTVRVDAAARSASGRVLGSPYEFTFTTPTVRLLAAEWYRKTGRFDGPAVIALRFNQAVRPRDAVAHAKVVLTPHDWEVPVMSAGARLRLTQTDPAGLSRFDEKVEAARRVASSTDPLTVRLADSWDEQRFPRDPARVVLETTTAPPTNAWLTVTLDASLPGAEGPETHAEQSSILRLEPTFFVNRVTCAIACDPATFNPVVFTRPVALGTFSRMLRVADADGSVEREIARARDVAEVVAQRSTTTHRLEDAGFDSQLPATTRRLELDSNLEATDGQTLGYPWVGLIQNAHALPVVTFGGEVWEASGGPELPVNVRNVLSVTQWLAPTSTSTLMPQLLPLQAPLAQTAGSTAATGRGKHPASDPCARRVRRVRARHSHRALIRRDRSRLGRGRTGGRVAGFSSLSPVRRHIEPKRGRAGHESRHHGQGQPSIDPDVRDASRHRRARPGRHGRHRQRGQRDDVARGPPIGTVLRWRQG